MKKRIIIVIALTVVFVIGGVWLQNKIDPETSQSVLDTLENIETVKVEHNGSDKEVFTDASFFSPYNYEFNCLGGFYAGELNEWEYKLTFYCYDKELNDVSEGDEIQEHVMYVFDNDVVSFDGLFYEVNYIGELEGDRKYFYDWFIDRLVDYCDFEIVDETETVE